MVSNATALDIAFGAGPLAWFFENAALHVTVLVEDSLFTINEEQCGKFRGFALAISRNVL